MHGMVPDAARFLKNGHFFIVPLLSGGGMRLKAVEAMAAGKCVVGSRIGLEGIACREGQEAYFCDTPQEWLQTLSGLLDHPNQSVAVAEAGRQLASGRYSWNAIGRQFEAYYEALIA